MAGAREWIEAARLRTLPLAFSSSITGAALASHRGEIDWAIFLFCLLTTLCLQVLSNYANDLGDHLHGTDDHTRVGPTRAIQSGAISPAAMKKAVIRMAIASLCSGLFLLYLSGLSIDGMGLMFFGLGVLAIIAAVKYTAGAKPYGYSGLGDISVFLFFGLIGVLGSFFLHDLQLIWAIDVLAASAIGFWSAAVLNLNNMRDATPDAAAGKYTLAVRLGRKGSRIYHGLLITLGSLALITYVYQTSISILHFLPLVIIPLMLLHVARVFRTLENRDLDPELKKVALSTFLMSVLLLLTRIH